MSFLSLLPLWAESLVRGGLGIDQCGFWFLVSDQARHRSGRHSDSERCAWQFGDWEAEWQEIMISCECKTESSAISMHGYSFHDTLELLLSQNVEIREQAVWALGNIAGMFLLILKLTWYFLKLLRYFWYLLLRRFTVLPWLCHLAFHCAEFVRYHWRLQTVSNREYLVQCQCFNFKF